MSTSDVVFFYNEDMNMEDGLRYARATDILRLILDMQAKTQGVTLKWIEKEYDVSRKTAERMRDCILNAGLNIVEIENPNSREKHWGIPGGFLKDIINFTPEELAALEKMKKYEEENGFEDKRKILDQIINKVRIVNKRQMPKIDNALELLLQSEGFAVKQMPKHKIDIRVMETIRNAMKTNKKIVAKYNGKDKLIAPYGLIYGSKIYLVGVEDGKSGIPFCYLLHKFSDVELTKDDFDKGDFNIDEFSKKSFGVYQGEAIDVKLLFTKEVAEDVLLYQFHSTQKVKQNEDGTVTVKFKASGEYEIMWHLFRWGADVKILSPVSLRKLYIELLENTIKHQKEK